MNNSQGRSRITAAVILIGLGILFLMKNLGYLDWNFWYFLRSFWPILLIIIGLGIILYRTRFWWLVPLIVVLLFGGLGLMNWGQPQPSFTNNLPFVDMPQSKSYSGYLSFDRPLTDNKKLLNVEINYKLLQLAVNPLESDQYLFDANLRYQGEKPQYIFRSGDEESKHSYLQLNQNSQGKFINLSSVDRWNLDLSPQVPLNFYIAGGAGQLNLNLKGLKVPHLEINSAASDITIKYSKMNNETSIHSGVSNINLQVPPEAGIRINVESVVSNKNFQEAGLIKKTGGTFISPSYSQNDIKININIAAPASNVNLYYQ